MKVYQIDDENVKDKYKIEVLYEIDENNENDYVYISSYTNKCSSFDINTHKRRNLNNESKGKKLILIEDSSEYPKKSAINICLQKYNKGANIGKELKVKKGKSYKEYNKGADDEKANLAKDSAP
uniref:Uncharacterized protein n=1 Tax=Meloidogyne javanica TaxID=6303 RepID=A0A915MC11_MELJA